MSESVREPEPEPAPVSDQVDLVVVREHEAIVRATLSRWGLPDPPPDSDEALGLSLLSFPREAVEAALSTWGNQEPAEGGPPALPDYTRPRRRARDGTEEPDYADELLSRLRAAFGDRYDRWYPTMGKNRFVGLVTNGGGTVSHGGGPPPKEATSTFALDGSGGAGITIGVLDTAVFPNPVLDGHYLAQSPDDLLTAPGPYTVESGHATFVTGLVLQRAPEATVRVRAVLDATGAATSWEVARAIVELGHSGIDILNLSLVCYSTDSQPPLVLATAVDRLPPEVLVVACTGNHGDATVAERLGGKDPSGALRISRGEPAWPAALDDVVAVGSGSSGPDGTELASFTPRAAPWMDVVVRGSDLLSTYLDGTVTVVDPETGEAKPVPFNGFGCWSGTSFSSALLSGEIARVAADKEISVREAWATLLPKAVAPYVLPEKEGEHPAPPFVDIPE
ncbi:S8/S53 family peptidase [Cellulomonas cellasea]|uniref:Peptidase S8/S53 domain-containing protein n=1 Tax=Cellulomonas cellasea TaxID=43670 RepID=A0A7W4UDK1_9CELL|nr:S8/S53 family peptidase [Cellulomonas cellasea]MBB2921588.1 hypothetical protein [Cellulomonas cellasea]